MARSDKLRLSKYHMSVIDELYENRDATELSFALDEKFERLRTFKQIPEIPAPATLQPILRPLSNIRLSMAKLFKRSWLGWNTGR